MTDGIGMCFQVDDHPYYSIVFPTADKVDSEVPSPVSGVLKEILFQEMM